jgi:hypothetical protein
MKNFNEKLAIFVTKRVGTTYCAYLFAIIGIMGIIGAFTGNASLVLIVGAISGYFLQLVLLPIIMVGQSISDKNSKERHDKLHTKLDAIHKSLKDK